MIGKDRTFLTWSLKRALIWCSSKHRLTLREETSSNHQAIFRISFYPTSYSGCPSSVIEASKTDLVHTMGSIVEVELAQSIARYLYALFPDLGHVVAHH